MANNINTEQFFSKLSGNLNERTTRLMAAAAASSMDYGGISQVSRLAGLSRPSIYAGMRELSNSADLPDVPVTRQRQPGGGRKTTIENDQEMLDDLNKLIKPYEHGAPEPPLKWTSKSLRKISSELKALGHEISHSTVRRLLKHLGYTLQSNKKSHEGSNSPDRNAQFEHISKTAKEFLHEEHLLFQWTLKRKNSLATSRTTVRIIAPKATRKR